MESKKLPSNIPVPKSKRGLSGFFSDVGKELRKVSWPATSENNRLTGVVLAVCLLTGLLLTAMSLLSQQIVTLLTAPK